MSIALEKHWRVRDIAVLWGVCEKTVTRIFSNESGVLRINNARSGKRIYTTLSIPESVVVRVHESISARSKVQALPAACRPIGIIRFRDLRAKEHGAPCAK